MNFLPQASGTRPRVACEIAPQGVVAARSTIGATYFIQRLPQQCVDCSGTYWDTTDAKQPAGVTVAVAMNIQSGIGSVTYGYGTGSVQKANLVAEGFNTFYWAGYNSTATYSSTPTPSLLWANNLTWGPPPFTTCTLTPCGATGAQGPTAAQQASAYASYTWFSTPGLNIVGMSSTQGYQTFTVPITGTYTITAAGAAGGGRINV